MTHPKGHSAHDAELSQPLPRLCGSQRGDAFVVIHLAFTPAGAHPSIMTSVRSLPRLVNVATVCLAVLLGLAACGGKASSEGSQVVATVNKSEISVHQVNQMLQRRPGLQAPQAENAGSQVLEQLIEQEVAVQKALDMKLDRDPAVMQNIAAARRDVLARAYSAKLADTAARPEPADLQAYFDARPALFAQRKVYALQEYAVQADKTQADDLGKFVTGAKSLQEVSNYLRDQKLSVRASQSTLPAESLPPALVERLSAMKDGQLLLLAAPGGARIVVLAGSRLAPVSLEQARVPIEQALMAERRMKAVQTSLDLARKASDIKYHGAFSAPASAPMAARAGAPPAATAVVPPPAASAATTTNAADAAMVSKGLAGLK
jgi:EpsD family peptidyl-prolyl cis-trans isomerase